METEIQKIQGSVELLKEISKKVYAAYNDTKVLTGMLNEITAENRQSLSNTYKNAEGPVKSIRKQVAAILKERNITHAEVESIIKEAQEKHPKSFSTMYKQWYNLLYFFVLANYRNNINQSVSDIVSNIQLALGNPSFIKSVKFDFSGERETGSTRIWIALFNSRHVKQNTAKQLFLNIENGTVFYSFHDRPKGTHIGETKIADGVTFNAENLIKLFKSHLVEIEHDDATIKSIKEIKLLTGESIFKVSMGPNDIDEESYNFLLNEQLAMVHKDTSPLGQSYERQGDVFTKKMKIGDYLYLCRGNKMILIGKVTGNAEEVGYGEWGDNGWVQRTYEIISQSVTDFNYTGEQKWWTPNFRSTCWQIPIEELELANNIFFSPFFQTVFIKPDTTKIDAIKPNDKTFFMSSLNTILYGPPGTGKTYHTITKAAEIITGKSFAVNYNEARQLYTQQSGNQIEFVTFHQNYSYEDFVAGLRPDVDAASIGLRFTEHKGIFYRICEKAKQNWLRHISGQTYIEPTFEEVLEVFLQPLVEDDEIEVATIARNVSFHITSNKGKNLGFRKKSGGTGHTLSISTLKELYEKKREYNLQGLGIYFRPVVDKLRALSAGMRKETGKVALQNYVLVIDEINRANISRVFGELITLLEPDKRLGETNELKLRLPGLPDEEMFGVPPNLYIVATMNTADKSIALIDIALRRRFVFEDMYPRPELVDRLVIAPYNNFLNQLNKKIKEQRGADFTIGHAYFLPEGDKILDIVQVLNHKVIPLLNEYFYNQRNNPVFGLISPLQTLLPGVVFIQDEFIGVKALSK